MLYKVRLQSRRTRLSCNVDGNGPRNPIQVGRGGPRRGLALKHSCRMQCISAGRLDIALGVRATARRCRSPGNSLHRRSARDATRAPIMARVLGMPGRARLLKGTGRRATVSAAARPRALHAAERLGEAKCTCAHLPIYLAKNMRKDHPVIARSQAPRDGFARKAGDSFGFSPSFTEWIFVVADCG